MFLEEAIGEKSLGSRAHRQSVLRHDDKSMIQKRKSLRSWTSSQLNLFSGKMLSRASERRAFEKTRKRLGENIYGRDSFPKVAITNHHNLGGLREQKCIVSQF